MGALCYANIWATEIVILYRTASIQTLALEVSTLLKEISTVLINANGYKINANSTEMRSPHKVSSNYTKTSKKVGLESLSR